MNEIAADEEIIEVFAEEAGEVFETIDNRLPRWREQPGDRNALTDIRRGFHTLKGSGRMVNALDLAEVAWKIENMLNRVLDGTIQASESIVKLVSTARGLMPKLLDAFRENRSMADDVEVENLMAQADAYAEGHSPAPVQARPAAAGVAVGGDEKAEIRIAELNRRLERFHQRSDEALHRSEMALHTARSIAAKFEAQYAEAQDKVGRAEVNRIIERVNLLAREVLELRREVERPQPEPQTNTREIGQLIDQRLRERMVPIEHKRSELEQQLTEANRVAAATRLVAWLALTLSILVGAGAAAFFLM